MNLSQDTDKTGKDKLKHASACCLIALYSTEASIVAAVTKEYADSKAKGNHWCWWDILYDFIGTTIGTIIRVLLLYWIFGQFKWNWIC